MGALFREINSAEPVRLVDLLMQEEAPLADGPITSSTGITVSPAASTSPPGADESSSSSTVGFVDNKAETAKAGSSGQSPAAETLVAMLDAAADDLAAKFPEMFKPSSRCKPPHLNVDVLRDDLFQSDFLPRHSVGSAAELLALLDKVNASLQAHYAQADVSEQSKSAATALKKATEHGFYLGLDKAWMYATHAPAQASKARRGKKA